IGSSNGMTGIVLALGAAVFYATVVLINKSIKGIDSIERTFFQFVSAVIVVLPYVLFTDGINIGGITLFGGINLLVLGCFHTGMAYLMYFSSVSNISGQQASLFGYTDPVTALVISAVVLQEVISPMQWIGGTTVLVFTLINEIEFKKSRVKRS
ncbi:MAG: DMT family transporter, partial [Firmicutes bacterium]|nr:DMT family transporter [Bacillota bacterium]